MTFREMLSKDSFAPYCFDGAENKYQIMDRKGFALKGLMLPVRGEKKRVNHTADFSALPFQ